MFVKEELTGWAPGYSAQEIDLWLMNHPGVVLPDEVRRMWENASYGRVGNAEEAGAVDLIDGSTTAGIEIIRLFPPPGKMAVFVVDVDEVFRTTRPALGDNYRPFLLDAFGNVFLWDGSCADGEVVFLDRTHWRAVLVCEHVSDFRELVRLSPKY